MQEDMARMRCGTFKTQEDTFTPVCYSYGCNEELDMSPDGLTATCSVCGALHDKSEGYWRVVNDGQMTDRKRWVLTRGR